MSTINVFLCLLGASRAGSLFIDPYNLKETMPAYFGSVMWDIGFPSIISAFSLVQLAFLHLTQLKLGPEKMRNKSCLSLIITAHFTCVVGFDIILAIYHNFYLVRLILETSFLVWGVFLCCTFLYAGYRVMALLRNMSGILLQRDPGTTQYKGIMQLAMLAPYNNLATSVAAALVPTLLAPNLHHSRSGNMPNQDEATSRNARPPLSPRSLSKPSTSSMDDAANPSTFASEPTYSRLESAPSTSRQNSVLKMTKSQSSESGAEGGTEVTKLKKNLSWRAEEGVAADVLSRTKISFKRRKPKEEDENQITAETTLLPQQEPVESGVPDLTLHTILNHIAYVNRAAAHSDSGLAPTPAHPTPASRKKQVTTVLRVTYATAILGLTLCLANLFQLFGPYGVAVSSDIKPWPWFCFQTLCRAVELAMGCAMANITKQPVTHRHQYLQHHYSHSIRIKQRESLFM
ncbi:uncharacterized protein LOC124360060 isoform X1 [Homalodisca vitripennis]|uniref:uncharacterized protein LOC124360060 isoform X1 n=1 Tax=Homalodisca vitripennis TaxID=197043 RepID=UPI001EEB195C|nr:uncharacterized protein LOC124360060 isoform X1 [Homalodisca vitripennis]XP_046669277.1 uncharacterized protein LOC124360060 isoform X1 [Homalodisca vitripennis]